MDGLTKQVSDDLTTTPSDVVCDDTLPGRPRHSRRLSDKVLVAFHQACDMLDLEIAGHLLQVVEIMLLRPSTHVDGKQRHNAESFVAAHERLWYLHHPAADQ